MRIGRRWALPAAVAGVLAAAGPVLADPAPGAVAHVSGLTPEAVVALSGDGHLALQPVGLSQLNVLRDTGNHWHTTVIFPVPPDAAGTLPQYALSGDGSTIAVAAGGHIVIRRIDATGHWIVEADLLVDTSTYLRDPEDLTLSHDGTLLVAAERSADPNLERQPPAGVFYAKGPAGWAPTGTVIRRASGGLVNRSEFVLDGAGDALAVAVVNEDERVEPYGTTVVVYQRSEGWAVPHLVATERVVNNVGNSIAFSRDGSTLAVRGHDFAEVEVYRRSGAGWPRSAHFAPATPQGFYGESLALSASGSTLLVGSSDFADGRSLGAGYRYVLAAGTWHWGGLLTVPASQVSSLHGALLSADGRRAVLSGTDQRFAGTEGVVFDVG